MDNGFRFSSSEQSSDKPAAPCARKAFNTRIIFDWLWFLPVALIVGMTVWRPLGPGDFWAHAAVGRWIVEHGQVPRNTLFLWSYSGPWVAHSWLTEVLLYQLINGLNDFDTCVRANWATVIAVGATFALIWGQWVKNKIAGPIAVFAFNIAVCGGLCRYQPRAEMLSGLLLALTLLLTLRVVKKPDAGNPDTTRKPAAAAIPFVFLLWSNIHGVFALGLAMLIVAAIVTVFQDRHSEEARLISYSTIASIIATCINPYGITLWGAVLRANSPEFKNIVEWTAAWQTPADPTLVIGSIIILALTTFGALAVNIRKNAVNAVWVLALACLYCGARRYAYLLDITCLCALGSSLQPLMLNVVSKRATRRVSVSATAAAVVFGIAVWQLMCPHGSLPPISSTLPGEAAEYIDSHNIDGPIFVDYNIASYMEWRLKPTCSLYIDSLNAYPSFVFDSVKQLNYDKKAAARHVEPELFRGVSCIVGRAIRPHEGTPAYYSTLKQSTNWQETDFDAGPMWVRTSPSLSNP